MSSLLIRGNTVHLKFSLPGYHEEHRRSLKLRIDGRKRIPPDAYILQQKFDSLMALGRLPIERLRDKRESITLIIAQADVTGVIHQKRRVTLHEIWEDFKANSRTRSGRARHPRSLLNYQLAVEQLSRLLPAFPADLTDDDFVKAQDKLRKQGYHPRTVFSKLEMLATVLNWGIKRGHGVKNPFRTANIERPEPRRPQMYSAEQWAALMAFTAEHNIGLNRQLRFLLYTAARASDSCRFTLDLVDFEHKILWYDNHKKNREEAFPLHRDLEALLRECMADGLYPNGRVFKYSGYDSLNHAVKRALNELGIKMPRCVHTIKTNANSYFDDRGLGIDDRRQLLHHKRDTTTLTSYTVTNVKRLRERIDQEDEIKALRRENERLKQELARYKIGTHRKRGWNLSRKKDKS